MHHHHSKLHLHRISFRGLAISVLLAGAAHAGQNFTLQGAANKPTGPDADHAGRAANSLDLTNPNDNAIYLVASDWSGAHDPHVTTPWPQSDGLIGWSYWDEAVHDLEDRGPAVVSHTGKVVYRDPLSQAFVLYDSDFDANPDHEKLYYRDNAAQVAALALGNNGVQSNGPSDRQQALLAQFSLQSVRAAHRSPDDLLSATFTIHIDDVINMDLVSTDGVLPSRAFVNVYAADGNLADYASAQAAFDRVDHSDPDGAADLVYTDPYLGDMPVTDFALARNALINGELTLSIDFDLTQAVRSLLAGDAPFIGLTLWASGDGDFTLGSIDPVVTDASGEVVLLNLLPYLTLEFSDLLGDMNGDGVLDAFDVSPFELALADRNAFLAAYPGVDPDVIGDFDASGALDAFDVGGFEAALAGTPTSVPQPASILLLLGAMGKALLARARRAQ